MKRNAANRLMEKRLNRIVEIPRITNSSLSDRILDWLLTKFDPRGFSTPHTWSHFHMFKWLEIIYIRVINHGCEARGLLFSSSEGNKKSMKSGLRDVDNMLHTVEIHILREIVLYENNTIFLLWFSRYNSNWEWVFWFSTLLTK